MNHSEFSVLMAVYKKDDPHLFQKALDSVIANNLQPTEIFIVADGEIPEQLHTIINEAASKFRLHFIQLPTNLGLAKALNAGLQAITSKYTIRADADDFNHPTRFERLLEKLEEGYVLVGSSIQEVDRSGAFVAIRKLPQTEPEIRKFIKKRNPFNHMTVGFRTDVVKAAGGYPNIHLKEDYALWATLLSKGGKVCNLPTILVEATAGSEMFQRRGGLKYALAEIDLQRHLVQCGLKSLFSAVLDGVLRSAVFLAPNTVRKFVYLKFLRTKGL